MSTTTVQFVRRWGKAPKRALFIHGLASSSAMWKTLAHELKKDYSIVAPDLSGHGRSSRRESYSIDSWAQELLPHAAGVELIVGHSLGGQLALRLQEFISPKHTVLIDPVLHLPRGYLLSPTQHIFRAVLRTMGWSPWARDDVRRDVKNWDASSSKALTPGKRLVRPTTPTLILRPLGSFIVPGWAVANSMNLKVVTLRGDHNLHRTAYDKLLEHTKNFIQARGTDELESLSANQLQLA